MAMYTITDIEVNAENVEQILSSKGPLPLRVIGDLTNFGESLLYTVLGWLANQNKIRFYSNKGMIYAEINGSAISTT